MTTKPHPFAHIFRGIADGHTAFQIIPIQGDGTWQDRTIPQVLELIAHSPIPPDHMRVAPRTITINGHEVPEPLRVLPPTETVIYWPSFGPNSTADMTESCGVGYYSELPRVLLLQGLLHLTREAASAHAQALISFTVSK